MDVLDRLLRPLRRGPVTSRYPAAAPELPPAARGLPELDPARCTGDGACVTVCPTGAISLGPDTWSLDAGACVFCGACSRACGREAIRLGGRIELASDERARLVVVETLRGPG